MDLASAPQKAPQIRVKHGLPTFAPTIGLTVRNGYLPAGFLTSSDTRNLVCICSTMVASADRDFSRSALPKRTPLMAQLGPPGDFRSVSSMKTSTNGPHAGSEVLTKFVISNRRSSREINFRSSTDRVFDHDIKIIALTFCSKERNTRATSRRSSSIRYSGVTIATKAKKVLMTSTQFAFRETINVYAYGINTRSRMQC
jgi:hypothetical protein